MTKQQKKKDPIAVIDTSYDNLVEQTQALLEQARNHNMKPDEIIMKFNGIVIGLSTDDA